MKTTESNPAPSGAPRGGQPGPVQALGAPEGVFRSTMKTYAEKLKDPRWQRKRLEILERDDFTCLDCGSSTKTLHVHHFSYAHGREPWDYDESNFRTLCDECHETRHACERTVKSDMDFIFARMSQAEMSRLTMEILHCLSIGAKPRAVEESFLTDDQIEGLERLHQ